jgi:hypothetical protein
MDFVLTVILSNYTLEKIFDFLTDYIGAQQGDIGPWRIQRKKVGDEYLDTNRMFMLMRRSLLDKAIKLGLNIPNQKIDFSISEYVIQKYPENPNLHIKIPLNLLASECETLLEDKMKQFVLCGLIKSEDYYLRTPLLSRVSGEHRGYINIFFKDGNIENISIIKILLDDCIIYKNHIHVFYISAFWNKSKKN